MHRRDCPCANSSCSVPLHACCSPPKLPPPPQSPTSSPPPSPSPPRCSPVRTMATEPCMCTALLGLGRMCQARCTKAITPHLSPSANAAPARHQVHSHPHLCLHPGGFPRCVHCTAAVAHKALKRSRPHSMGSPYATAPFSCWCAVPSRPHPPLLQGKTHLALLSPVRCAACCGVGPMCATQHSLAALSPTPDAAPSRPRPRHRRFLPPRHLLGRAQLAQPTLVLQAVQSVAKPMGREHLAHLRIPAVTTPPSLLPGSRLQAATKPQPTAASAATRVKTHALRCHCPLRPRLWTPSGGGLAQACAMQHQRDTP